MRNTLALAITNRCPLKCSFCCVPPGPGDLEDQVIERVLLEAIALKQFKSVGFTGGEPLIRLKTVLKFGKMLSDHQVEWGLTTGMGWANSMEKAEEVARALAQAGINHLSVSVDETHLKNKSPEIVQHFIDQAMALKVLVIVSVTRYQDEYNKALPIKVDASSPFARVEYHYVSKAGYASQKENTARPRFDLNNSHCPMTEGLSLSVWPDGSVYPCCSPSVVNKYPDLVMGNIHQKSLGDCLQGLSENLFLKSILNYGFSGLLAMTDEFEGWKEAFNEEIIDPCHLCSKICGQPGAIKKLNQMIHDKAMEALEVIHPCDGQDDDSHRAR